MSGVKVSIGTCGYCGVTFERTLDSDPEPVEYCKRTHRKKANVRRKLALADEAPCPHARSKRRFLTRAEAIEAAVRRSEAFGVDLYTYPCECHWWHLTSNPQGVRRPSTKEPM